MHFIILLMVIGLVGCSTNPAPYQQPYEPVYVKPQPEPIPPSNPVINNINCNLPSNELGSEQLKDCHAQSLRDLIELEDRGDIHLKNLKAAKEKTNAIITTPITGRKAQ